MPLNKSCSLEALRENIAAEIRSGRPRDQAVAIAHSTLRAACADEGKPTPSNKDVGGIAREFRRKRGERSQDYLEEALTEARKVLPHRSFAMLHQAARSRAGGKASARGRVTVVEKALLLGPEALTQAELSDAVERCAEIAAADMRRGLDSGGGALARMVSFEHARRELVATVAQKAAAKIGTPAQPISKGFASGDPDGGAHAHGLARSAGKTRKDGAHSHYFTMPGTGLLLRTAEDGQHEHSIADPGKTAKDGAHSHQVVMPDGRVLETSIDGGHGHELMLETSGLGAQHAHAIKLPDGTEITSLTVAQAPGIGAADSQPLPPASVILSAMRKAAALETELAGARLAALAAQAREAGETSAGAPTVPMTIVSMSDDGAEVESADGARIVAACETDAEAGDIVEVGADLSGDARVEAVSASAVAAGAETVTKALEASLDFRRHSDPLAFIGPDDARIVFVAGAPNELELARGEPFVGADGVAFAASYLAPLRLTKSQVAIGFAYPMLPRVPLEQLEASLTASAKWLDRQLERWPDAKFVALGKVAKAALGERAALALPHPTALRRGGERYDEEAGRKMRALAKSLDTELPVQEDGIHREGGPREGQRPGNLAGTISELRSAGQIQVRISKAADEKQIVYGVVLDPYIVDMQNEWVPPAEIESTAHGFVKKSRVIGLEHRRKASAVLVESFVMPYPTKKDYEGAMSNAAHRAYIMPYGEDKVHSGAWIAGVELGNAEWADYRAGKITGFSIGGFSFKTRIPSSAMPPVEFLRLEAIV